jgi:hypothetical protein
VHDEQTGRERNAHEQRDQGADDAGTIVGARGDGKHPDAGTDGGDEQQRDRDAGDGPNLGLSKRHGGLSGRIRSS